MKPNPQERDDLLESTLSAWRPRDAASRPRAHPAWHDLDAAGREEAFERTRELRLLEAALDPLGLSTTARAVLRRIERK
jgi:hypothetical protein